MTEMRKPNLTRQALSLLMAVCFVLTLVMPLMMPATVEAATPAGATDTPGALAQAAVQNIETLLQSPQLANDPNVVYAAYVLTLAGQDTTTISCVYNGTSSSLQSYVLASAQNIARDPNAVNDATDYPAKLIAWEILALNQWKQTNLAGQLMNILKDRQITSGSGTGSFDDDVFSDMPALAALGTAGELSVINQVYALGYILDTQNTQSTAQATYGCWGSSFDGTYYPDLLSTAWAVQALPDFPDAAGNPQIQAAIRNGLAWMRQQQQSNGSINGNLQMDDPVVDTAQTVITLKSLGVDPTTWTTSQGDNPVTYMLNHALNSDGSFGTTKNLMDAAWALYAYVLLGGSAGTGTAGGGTTPSSSSGTCTVSLAVVGETGAPLYGPATVTVNSSNKWGLTVLGALDASGLPYTMSTTFQGFVQSIDGEANSGMNGWMYAVNGAMGSVAASQEPISSYDQIIWWYSTSGMNSTPPSWNDLLAPAPAANTAGTPQSQTQSQSKETPGVSLPVSGLPASLQPSSADLTALRAIDQSLAGRQDSLGQSNGFATVVGTANPTDISGLAATAKMLFSHPVNLSQMVQAGSGATLTAPGSALALFIPPGALNTNTDITVSSKPDQSGSTPLSGVAGIQAISPLYDLGPTGTTFASPVTLILKVAIPPLVKPQNVCLAWYNPSSSKWLMIPSVVDVAQGLITAQISHFSTYAVFAQIPEKSFMDVTNSFNWAGNAIEALAGAGIITGVDATHFEPSLPVTRAELAAILVRALGIKETANASPLKDVTKGEWYAQAVNAAYAHGLVSGFPDGDFYPDKPVTREEMAVILARSLKLQAPTQEKSTTIFSDEGQISPWAGSSVSVAVADGLIKGLPDGDFAPKAALDRAEAAVLVYRVLMLK